MIARAVLSFAPLAAMLKFSATCHSEESYHENHSTF